MPHLTAWLVAVALMGATACGPTAEDRSAAPDRTEATTGAQHLWDGTLDAGRYRFVVRVDCKGVTNDPIACPRGVPEPPRIPLEVTVPTGWEHLGGFPVIRTLHEEEGQEGALVMGWTSNTVGLNSRPCSSTSHQLPDIPVGPGVDDFVEAVVAQKNLRVSTPEYVALGGASGRYFTLRGPADLSKCEEWRPWDPGFYAQGPNNIWEVWTLDVRGHRVVIVANYFPTTSRRTVAQLHRMVRSIRFVSA